MLFLHRHNAAEQAVRFTVQAGGEVKCLRNSSLATVPEGQAPEPIDGNGGLVGILEETFEIAVRLKCHDRAAAEVADEQLIFVFAKIFRCERPGPRVN